MSREVPDPPNDAEQLHEVFEKVNAMSKNVLNLLSDAEQRLQLFSSHYDIEQLMNAARLLVRIGT